MVIKQKRGKMKNIKALFLITNMIVAVFAFSWVVSGALGDVVETYKGKQIINEGSSGFSSEGIEGTLNTIKEMEKAIDEMIKKGVSTPPTPTPIAAAGYGGIVEQSVKEASIKGYKITGKFKLKDGTLIDPAKATIEPYEQGVLIKQGDINSSLTQEELSKAVDDGVIQTVKEEGSSHFSKLLGATKESFWDAALTGVQYAGLGYGAGQLIGGMIGMDDKGKQALSYALSAGGFTWKFLATNKEWFGENFAKGLWAKPGETGLFGTPIGALGTGLIVAAIIFALKYKKTSTETVTFSCLPWQAPAGGNECEKCNQDGEICNEYRCRSLGQSCQLVNTESETEKKCVWVNPKDVKSPGISPWEDVLTEGYSYTDVRIRPPGEGSEPGRMRIVRDRSKDGCVEAFTPLEFGIVTIGPDNVAEPAQCRIDYNHTLKYDEMAFNFGGKSFYLYNHSQQLALPSPSSIKEAAPELQHDGTYTLYVRCRDANGNENVDEFVIRFCVNAGPDTTPPEIKGTSIANEMPVKFNQTNVELDVYVNEPSECKWSREDRSYDNMEYEIKCKNKVWEMNNNMVYTCKTTLTGVSDRQENKFYFRCKDKPNANESERNTMQESYKFMLAGTEPLNILDIKPNGSVKGSTEVVSVNIEVETANGYKNGEAVCYYSDTGKEKDFIEFFNTGKSNHKQRLDLVEGEYKYYIKCLDLGGNRDDNFTKFKVEVDRDAPNVVRVYEENSLLKVVTDEDSECRYSTQSCNFKFEDGINMPYANQTEHVTEWKTENTYYVRCADAYGSMPLPNSCSIIIRPYDIVEQKVEE